MAANISMVAGWQLYRQYKDIEQRANELGFKMGPSRYSGMEFDTIALFPKDEESLPIYNREAEVFQGTLQDIEKWIQGIQWARKYDELMKVSSDATRQLKERKYQQRELLKTIREGKREEKSAR